MNPTLPKTFLLFVIVISNLLVTACQGSTFTDTAQPTNIPESTSTAPQDPTTAIVPSPVTETEIPDEPTSCDPTPTDQLGPFYVPDAPVRSSVGEGHLLQGVVLSTINCEPISNAQIEFWQVGPDGEYDDDHRATTFALEDGTYTFESNFPPPYSGRPPHIHILVSAEGFETLVTQYYPEADQSSGNFDLILIPIE